MQAIKNWTVGRPGNKAISEEDCAGTGKYVVSVGLLSQCAAEMIGPGIYCLSGKLCKHAGS